MVDKKQLGKNKGTSGGAAAAGGVGFQQSVAAYALAHVLVNDTALQAFGLDRTFEFEKLHLESAHAVDDVVIVGRRHRVLIQAKTSVALSDLEDSMYGKALRQFVNHHVSQGRSGDSYVLATSTDSSRRIVTDLTLLTESARLNSLALAENPLTVAEEDVLRKTRKLVLAFLADAGIIAPGEEEFLEVFRRIHILPLDLHSPKGRDLNSALMLLRGKAFTDSHLLWDSLLQLCRTLMIDRGSIDKAGLILRLGHHINQEGRSKTLLDEVALEVLMPEDPPVGKDVVLFYRPGHEQEEMLMATSERFNDDGSKTTVFTRDGFKYRDGSVQPILFRAATNTGAVRFLGENEALRGGRILKVLASDGASGLESNAWARAHKKLLIRLFEERRDKLACLVCGNPVSENGAHVVEIDEEGSPPATGVTHKRCQYPGLRVIGELKSPLFLQYSALRDFDFNRWIAAAQKGASILASSVVQGTATVLWNSKLPGHPRGSCCVRIEANDGSAHYVSNRGKVLKFSRTDAEKEVAYFNARISESLADGNPYCASEDRQYFGPRAVLLARLPRGTTLLQCMSASVVPFNVSIDKAYSNPNQYYAPLTLLVTLEQGDPVDLVGSIVFLTDPLKLVAFLDNWRQANFELVSIAAEVIDTDERFDRLVSDALSAGRRVLVDPLFDDHSEWVSGIELQKNPIPRA